MAEKPITQKQERFCCEYIECGNATEAYRRAYDAGKMLPATVGNKAAIVLKHPAVVARLKELRQPAIEKAQFTLESHLKELEEQRDFAKKKGNLAVALQAEIARGKAAGITREKPELTLEAIVFAMMGRGDATAPAPRLSASNDAPQLPGVPTYLA
jgi:phage terminase small subunit